ncbi:MAG: hypothetical protein AB1486_20390 [Planctomycetota bacterium]
MRSLSCAVASLLLGVAAVASIGDIWDARLEPLRAPRSAARKEALVRLLEGLNSSQVPELLDRCASEPPQVRLQVLAALAEQGPLVAGVVLALADARPHVRDAAVEVVGRAVTRLQATRGLDGLEPEASRRDPRVFPEGTVLSLRMRPAGPPPLLAVSSLLNRTAFPDHPLVLDPLLGAGALRTDGILAGEIPEAPADALLERLLEERGYERWRLPSLNWITSGASVDRGDEREAKSAWMQARGFTWPPEDDLAQAKPAERLRRERLELQWAASQLEPGRDEARRALALLAIATFGPPGFAASTLRVLGETGCESNELLCGALAAAIATGDSTGDPGEAARLILPLLRADRPALWRLLAAEALGRLPATAAQPHLIQRLADTEGADEGEKLLLARQLREWGRVAGMAWPVDPDEVAKVTDTRLLVEYLCACLAFEGERWLQSPRLLILLERAAALAGTEEEIAFATPSRLAPSFGARLAAEAPRSFPRLRTALYLRSRDVASLLGWLHEGPLADRLWAARGLATLVAESRRNVQRAEWASIVADATVAPSSRLASLAAWGWCVLADDVSEIRLPEGGADLMRSSLESMNLNLPGDLPSLALLFEAAAGPEAGALLLDRVREYAARGAPVGELLHLLDRVGYRLARDAPSAFWKLRLAVGHLGDSSGVPKEALAPLEQQFFSYSMSEELGRYEVALEEAGVLIR